EHTVRAPAVVFDDALEAEASEPPLVEQQDELDVPIEVEPEPSCLPDIVTAMVTLHAGVDADDAPTRIRDVVTELRAAPAPRKSVEQSPPAPRRTVEQSLPEAERIDPAVHEAVTWNPGPVQPAAERASVPALLVTEPSLLEPSPFAPAVLPARSSDVS